MSSYIGRFAPSPSGRLHLGSLVSALASYLDAKAHNGRWIIRMEDIDPPREEKGASEAIIHSLACHGMHPDLTVQYQSQHGNRYDEILAQLHRQGLLYACQCTSKQIKIWREKHQSCPCEQANHCFKWGETAWRLRVNKQQAITLKDRLQGRIQQQVFRQVGDFSLLRRDGLYAYQLAVVVDDWDGGMTHIVRGADLLEVTPQQIYLQQLLGINSPEYLHVPVVLDERGYKLSKQNEAPILDNAHALQNLMQATKHLKFKPIQATTIQDFYPLAIQQWRHFLQG